MAVFYGNDAFWILVLSTKKRYSSFLKKVFVFQKICFKVWEVSKFLLIVTQKNADLSKGRLFWISLVPFFRTYTLSLLALKWNLYEEKFSSVKTKIKPNYAAKLAERSNHWFLLIIWWSTFFKHPYMIMEWIEFNWLCQHMRKVWSSQAAILVL